MTEDVGHHFMRQTYYKNAQPSDQQKGLPQPPLMWEPTTEDITVNLPNPSDIQVPELDLRKAIEDRRTKRTYSEDHLTLEELSYLLWSTQGIRDYAGTHATLRTVPSAGARHAFETYLLVNRVESLEPGLYRYAAKNHQLAVVETTSEVSKQLTEACLGQEQVKNSAVTFFWVADLYRMTYRYGQRGYRYLHLDAGHVCQNLYLVAGQLLCGVCAIAAFDDEAMTKSLGLDGKDYFVVYIATLGKKKT